MKPEPATDAPAKPDLLHPFFEAAVRRHPDAVAVDVPPGKDRMERRTVSYAELDRQARAVAVRLAPMVRQECLVAVLLPKDSERLYSAQLGVLKSGAAFVCLDPAFPGPQIGDILDDAAPVALLTDAAGAERAGREGWNAGAVLQVADLLAAPNDMQAPAAQRQPAPTDLAYLIYTSGTTGRPKGVMIEHRGIANLVASDLAEFGLGPGDRVAQNSSPAYDSSIEETWLALASGATLVVMDEEAVRLGPDLVTWLQREAISVLCPPPTLLRSTGGEDPASALPGLRLLYVGGEALTQDVADRWAPGRRLVNGYGPTECSVTVLRAPIHAGRPVTIGRPVPGMRAWALDEALAEVADGVPGELCLAGPGLARGYHGNPEGTAEKFQVHPALGRIYRTGDLVRKDTDGDFHYLGRIDSQVKLRGYRIELEAVEARLVELPGVREAACAVQGDPPGRLIAFVVAEDPELTLDEAALQEALGRILPAHMVPSRIGRLEHLPRSLGGKLDRKRLPPLDRHGSQRRTVAPRTPLETAVVAAFQASLPGEPVVSVDDDFFTDLGGDSLSAAVCVSHLREESATAALAVRDIYEARTAAALAARVGSQPATAAGRGAAAHSGHAVHPALVTAGQALYLSLGLLLGTPLAWFGGFRVLPALVEGLGLIPFVLLSPLLGLAVLGAHILVATALTMVLKRLLIGSYSPRREPVWGGYFLRHWWVQQTARLIPWRLLEGSLLQQAVLRALGARIGRRVHIHRGVNISFGGWDLLEIGDDASLSQDSTLRLVDYEDGCMVLGPVSIGAGATLDTRAGMGPGSALGAGAYLGALSSLPAGACIPAGERWEGVPAAKTGSAPGAPAAAGENSLRPATWTAALLLAEAGIAFALALPAELIALWAAHLQGITARQTAAWLANPSVHPKVLLTAAALVTAALPLALLMAAALSRLMGRVREGVVPRWSWAYLRVWLKGGLVQSAGEWLSGTLFWPAWLRLAGMKVGRGCEISTILDVVPELIEIGPDCFFADGIYLGSPLVHQGSVTLARLRLSANTFLGNHAVVPGGRDFPEGLLLGICTAVDSIPVQIGSSWFGHPPFELPNREVVTMDRRFTHEPSFVRYWNRVFWESARFGLLIVPTAALTAWWAAAAAAEARLGSAVFLFAALPALGLALAAFFPALILALKWFLLGRVKPGVHPLWSCWCSRWDFHYVAWAVYARAGLGALENSLLLTWYLRAMGMHIGRRVVLGPGFSQVVDPDMLHFEDGATVSCLFQAHTFEDRVLKIDRVDIRANATVASGAVLLYGADIGADAQVAPHSVVMKRERLLPGQRYEGCPTKVVGNPPKS